MEWQEEFDKKFGIIYRSDEIVVFIQQQLDKQKKEIIDEIESGIKELAEMNKAGINPTMMQYAQILYNSIHNIK